MYMDDPTLADRVEAQGARFKTKVTELVCKGVPGLKTVSYEHGNLVNLNNEVSYSHVSVHGLDPFIGMHHLAQRMRRSTLLGRRTIPLCLQWT